MLKIVGFLIGEARTHREDLQERENQQGKKNDDDFVEPERV